MVDLNHPNHRLQTRAPRKNLDVNGIADPDTHAPRKNLQETGVVDRTRTQNGQPQKLLCVPRMMRRITSLISRPACPRSRNI